MDRKDGYGVKRIWIGFLLAGVFILTQADYARASGGQFVGCGGNEDKIIFSTGSLDDPYPDGIGIEVSGWRSEPTHPIVIGQDKTFRGVDITVKITALEGKAVYWREHTEMEEIKGTFNQESMEYLVSQGYECVAINSAFYKCYEKKIVCESNEKDPEKIYRYLNPESISIWLDPSMETEQFLGWGPTQEGRYPLRYLFPEKWALGAWTPEGMQNEDIGEWYPTGEEVWSFGQENPWFTFLFPDPNETDLPGQHLLRMSQPVSRGEEEESWYISRRVLGLYGGFYAYQSMYNSVADKNTGPLQCLIDSNSIPGDEGIPPSIGECIHAEDNHNFGENVTEILIYFSHIPLDLPGHWRIGIKAYQNPAKYDHGKEERIGSRYLSIGPGDYGWSAANYSLDDPARGFDSYVIVSTPCYATDPKSCVN
jgi:hypothetical protein